MATVPTPVSDPEENPTAPLDDDSEEPKEPSADELKSQLREAKAEAKAAAALAKEREETINYWKRREERDSKQPRVAAPQTAPEPDPLEELDLLTLLTEEKDPARIRKELAKAVDAKVKRELKSGNFVSKPEMESFIAELINGATHINTLVGDFPQLKDPKSEFFAETQKQLGTLSNDPVYKGTSDAVLQRMAAQQAKIALMEAGKLSNETDDRDERIANQRGGSRGRGRVADDVSLSHAEKDMARKLGVAEKDYLAQKRNLQQPGALGPAMTADRMMREYNG